MKTKLLLTLTTLLALGTFAHAQGTAFTYQGRLNEDGLPANGSYDLQFTLCDALKLGNPLGTAIGVAPVAVSNGLFTVTLDFGAAAFPGLDRWLELGVRTNGSTGAYTTLAPRQSITSTPYAIQAANAPFSGVTGLPVALGANAVGSLGSNPLELSANGQRALRLEPNANGGPNLIGGAPVNFVASGVGGATIAGGGMANYYGTSYSNSVAANFGTIGGGAGNTVQTFSDSATISGGRGNAIQTFAGEATIGGGAGNTIQPWAGFATIGGGLANTIQNSANCATIGGGKANTIQNSAEYATINGGSGNLAGGLYSVVGGGGGGENDWNSVWHAYPNEALGDWSVIAGGGSNTIGTPAKYSTIGGGTANTIQSAGEATIGGGAGNTIQNDSGYATISGGRGNAVQTFAGEATIGGGAGNTIQPWAGFATIGGGLANTIQNSANCATIGGGYYNTSSAYCSTIVGGGNNLAAGNYSFAAGRRAKANNTGSFVWCDSLDQDGGSIGDNSFTVRASGGIFLFTSGGNTGAQLAAGSGSWSDLSDRASKTNFSAVDGRQVLDRLAAIPMQSWNYKAQSAQIRHLGPIAQDFYAAFGLGEDDKHISTVDADGVALAAIQGLNEKLDEQQAENAELKRRLAVLENIILAQKTN